MCDKRGWQVLGQEGISPFNVLVLPGLNHAWLSAMFLDDVSRLSSAGTHDQCPPQDYRTCTESCLALKKVILQVHQPRASRSVIAQALPPSAPRFLGIIKVATLIELTINTKIFAIQKKFLRGINSVKLTKNIFQSTRLPEERMGVTKKIGGRNEFP